MNSPPELKQKCSQRKIYICSKAKASQILYPLKTDKKQSPENSPLNNQSSPSKRDHTFKISKKSNNMRMKFLKKLKVMSQEVPYSQMLISTQSNFATVSNNEYASTPKCCDRLPQLVLNPLKKNCKNTGLPPKPAPLSQMIRDKRRKNYGFKLQLIIDQTNQVLLKNQRSRSQQERTSNLTDISHFIDKEDEQSNRKNARRPTTKHSFIKLPNKIFKESAPQSTFASSNKNKQTSLIDSSYDSISLDSDRKGDILEHDTRQSLWRKNMLVGNQSIIKIANIF